MTDRLWCLLGRHTWSDCTCKVCGADRSHQWFGCKCSVCGKTRDSDHRWSGCKCRGCGKTRDSDHQWRGCWCTRCRQTRDSDHQWIGCVCRVCGKTREHQWTGCKCSVCGKTRDSDHSDHQWAGCKCTLCDQTRDSDHQWAGCKCSVCGKTRDSDHQWAGCECSVCGKTRDSDHQWAGCECSRCGHTRAHEWVGSKCRVCGQTIDALALKLRQIPEWLSSKEKDALRQLLQEQRLGNEEAVKALNSIVAAAARTLLSMEPFKEYHGYQRQQTAAYVLGIAGDDSSVKTLMSARDLQGTWEGPYSNNQTAGLVRDAIDSALSALRSRPLATHGDPDSERVRDSPVATETESGGVSTPSFTERDNLGTRHDSKGIALAYWMGERLNSVRKDPFIIFTFDTTEAARKALLELPCIHIAEDSQKLICTEPLIFGYYQIEDVFEAVLCGDDLTHELWEQANSSFCKHGGRRKSDQEPTKYAASVPPTSSTEPDEVVFIREERKQGAGGTAVYRVHRGPNKASAMAFLQQNPVTAQLVYIVVETPDGNYCRDNLGIYKED